MQMTITNQQVSDGFSWRRVLELYAYYGPWLKTQCLIYLAVSLFCSVLTLMPAGQMAQYALFTLSWTFVPYMFLFAPIVFARTSDSRIIERLLPARASEKMVFYLSYLFLVVPVVTYTFPYLAMHVYLALPGIQTEATTALINLKLQTPFSADFINALGMAATVLTCLYVVKNAKTNRILKGIGAALAVQVAASLIGACFGFLIGLKRVNSQLDEAFIKTGENADQVAQTIIHEIAHNVPFITVNIIIFGGLSLVMLWLLYQTLSRRNL